MDIIPIRLERIARQAKSDIEVLLIEVANSYANINVDNSRACMSLLAQIGLRPLAVLKRRVTTQRALLHRIALVALHNAPTTPMWYCSISILLARVSDVALRHRVARVAISAPKSGIL